MINGNYVYCIQTLTTTNATEKMHFNKNKFVDFGVDKASQFSKYNVRRNFIIDVETRFAPHRVLEV